MESDVPKRMNPNDAYLLPFYRYLITGGCGFIGSSFIARLLRENPETNIRVLDNFLLEQKMIYLKRYLLLRIKLE